MQTEHLHMRRDANWFRIYICRKKYVMSLKKHGYYSYSVRLTLPGSRQPSLVGMKCHNNARNGSNGRNGLKLLNDQNRKFVSRPEVFCRSLFSQFDGMERKCMKVRRIGDNTEWELFIWPAKMNAPRGKKGTEGIGGAKRIKKRGENKKTLTGK